MRLDAISIGRNPPEEVNVIVEVPVEGGTVRMPGVVPRLGADAGGIRWPGEALGASNHEVFCGLLGLTDEELAALRADGVV